MGLKLTGQRNQCGGCRQHFNSNSAFDKHRIGKYGPMRRCMLESEMLEKGMVKNLAGFWCTKKRLDLPSPDQKTDDF